MRSVIFALLLIAIASAARWAVLVCGSQEMYNYRHHADVAHAYQVMKESGLDADHIVTMMYNDVPFSKENPFPGELYNHPGDNPPNVYKDIVIDYEGNDVNIENLRAVFLGLDNNGKKVLHSTKDDNIFFYYSDHGGPGMLGMPTGYLYDYYLDDILGTMHDKQLYKKFVIYIEACHSGSMFNFLPSDWNIVAVTAANPTESSWGWYCDDEAVVKGTNLGTCLGDEFSIHWMEDTDHHHSKTLQEQFQFLEDTVILSHVMRYGDTSFKDDPLSDYIGNNNKSKRMESEFSYEHWDSRDNEMLYYLYKYEHTTGKEQKEWKKRYDAEILNRKAIDRYFAAIAKHPRYYKQVDRVMNYKCYEAGIKQFEDIMGRSDYALKYFNVLANMCNENPLAFHN